MPAGCVESVLYASVNLERPRFRRNAFTADEEALLVKYIATYRPTPKGRSGITLYRTLCENEGNKWRWSKTHTWQSWRDQYVKNSRYYDQRIQRYQKKHGISPIEPQRPLSSKLKREVESDLDYEEEEEDEEEEEEVWPARLKRRKIDAEYEERCTERYPKRMRESKRIYNLSALERGADDERRVNGHDGGHRAQEEEEEETESEPEVSRNGPITSDNHTGNISGNLGQTNHHGKDLDHHGEAEGSEEQVGKQLLDISREPSQVGSDTNGKPQNEIPPHASDQPRRLRRTADNVQAEASTSRVQLSPSHQVPSSFTFNAPHPPPPSKSRQKRVQEDEAFFRSDPSSPSPPESLSVRAKQHRHRPPQLIEGPFGNAFAGARWKPAQDSETDEVQTWPPVRKRKDSTDADQGKEKGKKKGALEGGTTPETVTTSKSGADPNPPKVLEKLSRNQPPCPATRPAKEKQRLDEDTPMQRRQIQASHASEARSEKGVQAPSQPVVSTTPREPPPVQANGHVGRLAEFVKPPQVNGTVPGRGDQPSLPGQEKTKSTPQQGTLRNGLPDELPEVFVPAAEPPTAIPRIMKSSSMPKMPRESWTPGDPFMSRPEGGKPKGKLDMLKMVDRRHTLNHLEARSISSASSSGKRIDLWEELRLRRSFPGHARTASRSLSRSTPERAQTSTSTTNLNRSLGLPRSSLLPIPVADEDREKIDFLGMSAAIKMMAANFGFREESVWRMWRFFKNIGMTEEFCRRYRSKMGRMEEDVLEEMEMAGVDLEGLFREREVDGMFVGLQDVLKEEEGGNVDGLRRSLGMDVEGVLLGGAEEGKDRGRRRSLGMGVAGERRVDLESELHTAERRVSRSPVKETQLRVRPLVDDDDAMSDYMPPHSSRAGQYVRLVNQGRKEEALAREERRASGGMRGFTPWAAMEVDDSPTKQIQSTRSLGKVVSLHDAGGRQSQDVSDVNQEDAEVQEEIEVADEVTDEDGVEEGGTEPPPESDAMDDLFGDDNPSTEEEVMVLLSADKGNAAALREMEQGMDVDFMYLWTAARLAEFRSSIAE